MKFAIDVEKFCDEIFDEMERVSEGGEGHECTVSIHGYCSTNMSRNAAANLIAARITPFIKDRLTEIEE